MYMFAETTVEIAGVLAQFGPAALAALAVWWLTNKYEKLITEITSKHFEGMEMLSTSIKEIKDELVKRDASYQSLMEKKITAFQEVAHQLNTLATSVKENERRLEEIERTLGAEKKTVNRL